MFLFDSLRYLAAHLAYSQRNQIHDPIHKDSRSCSDFLLLPVWSRLKPYQPSPNIRWARNIRINQLIQSLTAANKNSPPVHNHSKSRLLIAGACFQNTISRPIVRMGLTPEGICLFQPLDDRHTASNSLDIYGQSKSLILWRRKMLMGNNHTHLDQANKCIKVAGSLTTSRKLPARIPQDAQSCQYRSHKDIWFSSKARTYGCSSIACGKTLGFSLQQQVGKLYSLQHQSLATLAQNTTDGR